MKNLISTATAKGLTSTFTERMKEYAKRRENSHGYFVACTISLLVLSMFFLVWVFYPNFLGSKVEQTGPVFFIIRLLFISVISPLVWLGLYFSGEKRKLLRLEEEYAHKWVVSRSYVGFREEAKKLEEIPSARLQSGLLDAVVDAISYNPSLTLDKKDKKEIS